MLVLVPALVAPVRSDHGAYIYMLATDTRVLLSKLCYDIGIDILHILARRIICT